MTVGICLSRGCFSSFIYCIDFRHSLLATELLVQLRDIYNVGLTVQDLFTYPTIASLSRLLDTKLNKSPPNGNGTVAVIPTFDLTTEVDRHDQGNVK